MKKVFEGRKFDIYAGEYRLPNNVTVYREYVDFGESVAILPIRDNEILLIKQYRMPINKWIYEVPAGTLEKGEDPSECAVRELIEETGYKPREIIHLFSMYLSPGYSNEYMHVYLARDLEYVGARPEKGELINIEWVRLDKALDLIRENSIEDGKSIAAILYYVTFYHR